MQRVWQHFTLRRTLAYSRSRKILARRRNRTVDQGFFGTRNHAAVWSKPWNRHFAKVKAALSSSSGMTNPWPIVHICHVQDAAERFLRHAPCPFPSIIRLGPVLNAKGLATSYATTNACLFPIPKRRFQGFDQTAARFLVQGQAIHHDGQFRW